MVTTGGDAWADVTAVILAGGVGSRLRSVVSDRPKGLAEIHGRPFLAYLLDQLADAGARRVVFSTGHLAAQVEAAFGPEWRGMQVAYSPETGPLGTGGGLRLATDHVATPTLLVMNGDSFCAVDLTAFVRDHVAHGRAPALVLAHQADTSRFGRVECDAGHFITAFLEKAEAGGPGWINAGIYAVERSLVAGLPADRPVSLEREAFPAWIAHGLRGFPCRGAFLDIGTPESYAAAEDFFARLPRSAP
ncbi:MAG: nucleotidyltransferase family protein [Planctomycetaceae bacterium]